MNKLVMRERAAKCLYEADLKLNDEMSIRELVDLLEKFGNSVARDYYQCGVSDAVLNRVNNRLCGNLSDNPPV